MKHHDLTIYNSLTRKKEKFVPLKAPFVGFYVCGPTVYSDVHLGNCRTFINFDIVYRYLLHLGYTVRYVRNITDVGHLVDDVDIGGEDKIAKKARLEQKEPMEIVQHYTNGFHDVMKMFNTLNPSIEPSATGHIVEQIEMVKQILDNGFAYVRNGSVYFKTLKLAQENDQYGKLSGKIVDDLLVETRDLKNQSEKDHPSDFAIWVKAAPEHIMRWDSPWSVGFPGWHLECSVMSTKYLGKQFDIHGGGMDLKFPHHENEIAQNMGCCRTMPSRYWMHANMLTMNGTKMSKSLGNSVLPDELFSGENDLLAQAYSPMVVRFFMLQTHYRSTLDFSDDALQAGEKGFQRLMEAYKALQGLEYPKNELLTDEDAQVNDLLDRAFAHMDDDFNTPQALARIFELVTKINRFNGGIVPLSAISKATLERLKTDMQVFIFDIFGLQEEADAGNDVVDGLLGLIINLRKGARTNRDWATSDQIRDTLKEIGIQLKDSKEGTTWSKV